MFRSVTFAALLGLGLCGTAQAQGGAPEPAVRSPQAIPAQARRAERPVRPQRRVARTHREHRSATYPGGRGATWKTGPDSHGFAGTLGGCRFRGNAGPNGYRLDRDC